MSDRECMTCGHRVVCIHLEGFPPGNNETCGPGIPYWTADSREGECPECKRTREQLREFALCAGKPHSATRMIEAMGRIYNRLIPNPCSTPSPCSICGFVPTKEHPDEHCGHQRDAHGRTVPPKKEG